MTKRQLIDEIVTLNHTAEPAFLARFEDQDLREYLDHLQASRAPRPWGETHRYDKYFVARTVPEPAMGLDVNTASQETDAAERAALLADEPPAEESAAREPAGRAAAQTAVAQGATARAAGAPTAGPKGEDSCSDLDESEGPDMAGAADADAAGSQEEAGADNEDEPADQDQEIDQDPGREEEEALTKADDDAEPALADEHLTTRRESVSARIAKAWREVPQVAVQGDEDDLDIPREADCDGEPGEPAESRPASTSAKDDTFVETEAETEAGAGAGAGRQSAGKNSAEMDSAVVAGAKKDMAQDHSAMAGPARADVVRTAPAASTQDLAPVRASDEDEGETFLF
jgi:hypothetical protein